MDRIHRMSRGRKTLLSLLLVGALGAVAGIGTYSAFSATTVNAGNTFDAGTVVINDNDAGSAMYNITAAKPNDVVVRCIRVTYAGSLPSTVRLYTTTPVNAFGQYVTLSVDKGTMPGATTFPNCTGFTSESNVFNGTLSSFAAGNTNFGTGSLAAPGAQTQWNQNDSLVYQFTLTMQDNPLAVGGTSGTHNFTWEAQNV
jgi:Camelysin metallo-endopeptidase